MEKSTYTIKEAVKKTGLSERIIRNLSLVGYVRPLTEHWHKEEFLFRDDIEAIQFASKIPGFIEKICKMLPFLTVNSTDQYLLAEAPDFIDYLFYHNVLDKFCWLIKLHYSERKTVKSKKYRLEVLLQQYLLKNKISTSKLRSSLLAKPDIEELKESLIKGWYNEIIRSDPISEEYLRVGTDIGGRNGPGTNGFAPWNIIQSYYASFAFLNT